MRNIKSFVRRQGRFPIAKKQAMENDLLIWGVVYQPFCLHLIDVFKREAPCILEIGFGMGLASADIAIHHPQYDYLCVEVHSPGVASLLKLIAQHEIRNIRIIHHDAVPVVEHMLPNEVLAGIHLFFPDPWPKKRHHKRRLIQIPFVELLINKLKVGGYIYCATDWVDYAEHIKAVLSAFPMLMPLDQDATIFYRPTTKFEQRGRKLGHQITNIIFVKR